MATKHVIYSPGTDNGPCLSECEHNDCYQDRRDVEVQCPMCGEAIGYDRTFFFHDGCYMHAICLADYINA